MSYTEDYHELKSVFDPGIKEIRIPGSSIRIINENFTSDIDPGNFLKKDDSAIAENISFSYPVFVPDDEKSRKAILLLHGLNERNWQKYLVWAYRLSVVTGSYVILFPISFHINRSPLSWTNPRLMQDIVKERNRSFADVSMSTFANIALSKRLTEEPMRFFNSGYQTAFDIVKLMKQIKSGEHEIIPEGSSVNIFAYSIGAFLSEILMLGNPDQLFSSSRLFMFCGGSVFSNMYGTSKYIMDSAAYKRIYSYYMDDFEEDIKNRNHFSDFLRSTQIGIAFRAMIDLARFRQFRESMFSKLREQIRSIALKNDRVIPAGGIVSTLSPAGSGRSEAVEIWDFPYSYSHENPFPVVESPEQHLVDRCFEKMITKAGLFLA
jgi:hypothetical protein